MVNVSRLEVAPPASRPGPSDSQESSPPARVPPGPRTATTALALGALGVVFGDIGTSPLYAIQQVFTGPNTLTPDQSRIYGVLSLVFWSLTIIVTVKYVAIVMRANNDGEGGIMALVSLVKRMHARSGRVTIALILLGVFGASLFYGDGMITPAISVLSAVEGLKVATPGIGDLVIPIALVLLVVLFVSQRYGTHAVGRFFGPVMLIWFSAIAALGIAAIADHPGILRALSPSYAVSFFLADPQTAFFALASVVLVVTGAEALYADMGHFGAGAIRRAWLLVALPALLLNYFGQGAFLLGQPAAADNPFFRMSPAWAQLPLVLLATMATVIASQAVISGAFSMSRQAVQLGFLPRMTIRHTSSEEIGQVYVPAVNWILFAAVVALVLGFRSSSHLASAYGIAVTGTFVTTTVLAMVVFAEHARRRWLVVLCGAAFLLIDVAFFSANLTKLLHGGWFPLAIAGTVFAILSTWRRGRQLALQRLGEGEIPLDAVPRPARHGPADARSGYRRLPDRDGRRHPRPAPEEPRAQPRAAPAGRAVHRRHHDDPAGPRRGPPDGGRTRSRRASAHRPVRLPGGARRARPPSGSRRTGVFRSTPSTPPTSSTTPPSTSRAGRAWRAGASTCSR